MRALKVLRLAKLTTCFNLIPTGNPVSRGLPIINQLNFASTDTKPADKYDIKKNIQAFFPTIIDDLVQNPEFSDIPETLQWCQKLLNYNLEGGKMNRGQALVGAYYLLDSTVAEDSKKQTAAYAMGCVMEILQAYLLILDDIMDQSKTRRGKPCWYKLEEVGLTAINDAVLLESFVYTSLTKYLKDFPCYINCLTLFHDMGLRTTLGENLDLMCINYDRKAKLEFFNEKRYAALVKYKTSYYSFYLPIGMAMYMANIDCPKAHEKVREISFQIGHLFQVQDDYLDCFGKFEDTGKEGTDIQEGKCTWLIVKALQKASEEQLRTLKECYGSKDEVKVAKVKAVYKNLKIDEEYLRFEETSCKALEAAFNDLDEKASAKIFSNFLQFIYKRRS